MAPIELYCDCQGTLDVLWGGHGLGPRLVGPGPIFGPPFGPAFRLEISRLTKRQLTARCQMSSGKTALWDKRANDSVDSYAKMGAAKHHLREEDVDLYRGLKCLVEESA
eukprot:5020438-Pyramimonas_sp.AAC.1